MELIEISRLNELEIIIENGFNTFIDVGNALLEIRDNKLYRRDYSTFEDYCRDRWGFVASRARQLIASAEVIENLKSVTKVTLFPNTERQTRSLTKLEPDQQREVWQRVVETAPEGKITAAHVQNIVDDYKRPVSYHISDDSYEWFTPSEYIEAARYVMGSIDLDPASSKEAQEIIKADVYYTKEIDGLSQPWFGNVWLNPPYNMPLIEQFIDIVLVKYLQHEIKSAIVLTNNSTDTEWFHKLVDFPICFTRGRIKFWNGDEKLVTRQGQALFYLGNNPDSFANVFCAFGVVVKRYDNK